MTDTTTIEIREDQRDALSDLKQFDRETYKEVLDRLLEGDTTGTEGGVEFSNGEQMLSDEIHAALEESERQVAAGETISLEELSEKLTRIESSVKEATNAAQSADRKLEDLGR